MPSTGSRSSSSAISARPSSRHRWARGRNTRPTRAGDAVADAAAAAREATVADTAADAETGCATTGAAVPPLRRLHPNRLPSRLRRRTPHRQQPRPPLRRPSAAAIAEDDVIAAEGTSPEHRRPEAHSLRAATRSRPDAAAFGGGSGCVGARIGLEKAGGAGRRGRSSSERPERAGPEKVRAVRRSPDRGRGRDARRGAVRRDIPSRDRGSHSDGAIQ